jgi:putative zinc finger/helix-turn-helix YgiT family protein
MKSVNCPKGHGNMKIKKTLKHANVKGVGIKFNVEMHVCPVCGFEAGTIQSAGAVQKAMADAYRSKKGLLTGQEITSMRRAKGLSQQDLAKLMGIGIASIKRWETGLIQTKSMDMALRANLQEPVWGDPCTGNRDFSIPRVKLVIRVIEKKLGASLLKKNDKMLFVAKYLWYADMLAFRMHGRSMTGSTYAALPYGPQLNNYKDLIEDIISADESLADELTENEIKIVDMIVEKFPDKQLVYDAAHQEKIWKNASKGALIPYTQAHDLTGI